MDARYCAGCGQALDGHAQGSTTSREDDTHRLLDLGQDMLAVQQRLRLLEETIPVSQSSNVLQRLRTMEGLLTVMRGTLQAQKILPTGSLVELSLLQRIQALEAMSHRLLILHAEAKKTRVARRTPVSRKVR
jgi:hypothetical protein